MQRSGQAVILLSNMKPCGWGMISPSRISPALPVSAELLRDFSCRESSLAKTDLECVRCLDPFSQLLKWTVTDLYAFDKSNITESGLLVPEDGQIDLEPLLREYALLEVPISPVCKPDCKGLCPVCGENLNKTDCGHRPQANSPFAALKDLL